MYVEHYGREPLEVRTSLANQVLRQDPALYALAVCCLSNGNTRLITSPVDDSPRHCVLRCNSLLVKETSNSPNEPTP